MLKLGVLCLGAAALFSAHAETLHTVQWDKVGNEIIETTTSTIDGDVREVMQRIVRDEHLKIVLRNQDGSEQAFIPRIHSPEDAAYWSKAKRIDLDSDGDDDLVFFVTNAGVMEQMVLENAAGHLVLKPADKDFLAMRAN